MHIVRKPSQLIHHAATASFFDGRASPDACVRSCNSSSSAFRFVPKGVVGVGDSDFRAAPSTAIFGGVRAFSGVIERLRLPATSFRRRTARVLLDAEASA